MRILVFALGFALFTNSALAQESRGTITGQVSGRRRCGDPESDCRHLECRYRTVGNSDNQRERKLCGAAPAAREVSGVTAEITGFKRFVREGIELSVNDKFAGGYQTRTVGEVTQSITVNEGAPLLETADASMGQVMRGNELRSCHWRMATLTR